jgi:hypothetical protein
LTLRMKLRNRPRSLFQAVLFLCVLAAFGCSDNNQFAAQSVGEKDEARDPLETATPSKEFDALVCGQNAVSQERAGSLLGLAVPQNCARKTTDTTPVTELSLTLVVDVGPEMEREGWKAKVLADLDLLCQSKTSLVEPQVAILAFDGELVSVDETKQPVCDPATRNNLERMFRSPLKTVTVDDLSSILKDSWVSAGLQAIQEAERRTRSSTVGVLWVATNRPTIGSPSDHAAAQRSLAALRSKNVRFVSTFPPGRSANLPSSLPAVGEHMSLLASGAGVSFEDAAPTYARIFDAKQTVRYSSCHLVKWHLLDKSGSLLKGRRLLGETATDGFERVQLQESPGAHKLKIWRLCEDGVEQDLVIDLGKSASSSD